MAKTGTRKRRHWSDAFKKKLVDELVASGKSASALAQPYGLNPNLLQRWRKKFEGEAAEAGIKNTSLVPVTIAADEAVSRAGSASADVLEIMLPCGSHLRCGAGMEPALLGQALVVLRPRDGERIA